VTCRYARATGALITILLANGVGTARTLSSSSAPQLGVATHFDQGWSLSLLGNVSDSVNLNAIRDDLPWGKIERRPGVYTFDGPSAAYVARACARGMQLLLMIDPRHPTRDGAASVYSASGQRAYANYLNAVLDRYGTRCIRAIEVGNEINAGDPRLPKTVSMVQAHTSLLRTVSQIVKPRHPQVKILGGSSNMVATGFLDTLFAEGALRYLDGVVVHPYRDFPEGVDVELERLVAAMRRHGTVKPIWATETGDEVEDPRTSASLLVRMLSLLAADPHMAAIYWYALIDEPYFKNTGLLDRQARMKPAGQAMRLMRDLFAKGRPARLYQDDSRSYVFRFGANDYVIWGVPRPLRIEGAARILDARGQPFSGTPMTSADPVIVLGAKRVALVPSPVIADSLYQYARSPWSYHARRASGAMVPLSMVDWTWTSYWGQPDLRPLEIGASSGIPAGDGANPLAATVRYTAASSGPAAISLCLTKAAKGDGVAVDIRQNGRAIGHAILRDRLAVPALPVRLQMGDRIDFAFGPNKKFEADAFTYRIRILNQGASRAMAAPCA
jgi:hypothetical protein